MERPNKTREEEYRKLLPAEKALVKTAALMMCGRTSIPARLIAMTYGLRGGRLDTPRDKRGRCGIHLWAALPVSRNNSSSS